MQSIRVFIAAVAVLFVATSASAQTVTTGKETKKADVNFTELSNYYEEHPMPLKRRLPFDEDEEMEESSKDVQADPAEVHMLKRSAARQAGPGGPVLLPVSPSPVDTFLSTTTNGTNIPPDTHGAVSPQYCMSVLNTDFHIQSRKGKNVRTNPINGFWSTLLPSGTDGFDPKIIYDPYNKRWVVVTDAVNQSTMGSSTILIAVSATCNPLGIWHQYAVTVDATDAAWLDYPNIGFNGRWVTITGNMFANTMGGATGAVVYVFDYVSMMSGSGAPFTKISKPTSFTLCPAITYDATLRNMFLIEVSNRNMGQLHLWKISGATASPTMTSVGNPSTTQHWKGSGPGGNDFAQQLGTTDKLDAGDDRFHRLTFRNNKLWCANSVFLPATGGATRSSIMWWQIDTLANPIQNGLIDDPSTPTFYFYPSIAVNANDDALIGFGYSNSNVHPSCAYALRMSADPLDSMRPAVTFRNGRATYYQTFGGAKNRWGDYSAACVDPLNDIDFWTIQESVPLSPTNYWDTWWGHIQISSGTPGLSATYDTVDAYVFDSIKFAGTISPGTIATWNFSGGTAIPGTGTGNQKVKWTTTGREVVTLTDSVPGCTLVFTDTVFVRPASAVPSVVLTASDIQMVPNPSNGVFDVLLSSPAGYPAKVTIVDMQGRMVYADHFNAGSDKLPVKTKDLSPGTYVVNIDINNNVVTKKITIDK